MLKQKPFNNLTGSTSRKPRLVGGDKGCNVSIASFPGSPALCAGSFTSFIIPASKIDIDQIYELEKRIFAENECISRSQLRYFLSSPNAAFFMLYDNKTVVGYGIVLWNRLRNGQYKGRIYSIGVLPEYKNKGAGSFLLDAMEEYLIKSGVSFIVLETIEGRDGAKLFFLKHGYTESKFLPNYYPYGDGVRMRKVIEKS